VNAIRDVDLHHAQRFCLTRWLAVVVVMTVMVMTGMVDGDGDGQDVVADCSWCLWR